MPALSLVIPAFNEERVIEQAVREASTALNELGMDHEILVIDDGSTDRTAAEAWALGPAIPRLRVLGHEQNRGYGAALRTGFEAARFERIAFTDADCQFDLRDLGRLVEATAHADLAVGRRVERKDPLRRRFLSWGYNTLTRMLLGTRVRDCDCALKVFRREALAQLLPDSCGFFANAEMLTRARLRGLTIVELPVAHRPRAGGESKVSLWEIPRTLRSLLPFWWRTVVRGRDQELPLVLTGRIVSSGRPPAGVPPRWMAPGRRAGPSERTRESV